MIWKNIQTGRIPRYDSVAHSGKWSSRINHKEPYGIGTEARLDTVFTTGNRMVKITGWVLSPKGKTESTLVVDFQSDRKSISYNPFYLRPFVVPGIWTYFESAFYVPRDLPDGSTCKIYFYNPMYYFPLYTDDVEIIFLSLKDEAEYRRIEGVLLPF